MGISVSSNFVVAIASPRSIRLIGGFVRNPTFLQSVVVSLKQDAVRMMTYGEIKLGLINLKPVCLDSSTVGPGRVSETYLSSDKSCSCSISIWL